MRLRRAGTGAGLLAAFILSACTAGVVTSGSGPTSPSPPATVTASTPSLTAPAGIQVVGLRDLPPEAAATLALIAADGPFPFRQDGVVFENREGLLPGRPTGYYHEYTVPTPGSGDRGARRIVTGRAGERYWTADHYDSFAWIAP